MNKLKSLINSKLFLAISSIVSIALSILLILPVSRFIINESVDVVTNFYMVAGLMFLLALSSLAQSFFIVAVIWGKPIVALNTGDSKNNLDDDSDFSVKSMKVTGAKKSFIFGAVLALNILAFDMIGDGVLVTGSKRYHVLTQLRSTDVEQRTDAAYKAIQLVGDAEVADALRRIIETPGGAREWAVYAAGIRRDTKLADPIANLLRSGTSRERAAAAVALARLEDSRLIRLVIDAWPALGDLQADGLIALGMVGKKRLGKNQKILLFSEADLSEIGDFLVHLLESGKLDKVLTRLAIWCLNKFESPEGLGYLESLLQPVTDTQTLCVALEALGNIGAADSSPELVAFIKKADKEAECRELVATDFTGKEVLICSSSNLVARIIYEIGHIGDYRAVPEMSRLAENMEYRESIRNLAKEFVFKMQYQPRE
jgi:HEAT repeat protein